MIASKFTSNEIILTTDPKNVFFQYSIVHQQLLLLKTLDTFCLGDKKTQIEHST